MIIFLIFDIFDILRTGELSPVCCLSRQLLRLIIMNKALTCNYQNVGVVKVISAQLF